ncbi:hypothetical protein JZ751_012544 [Albula glossodonta]|uniref:DUF4704 domain-containing protein n=1 Tax=Albula glossodonta TaxID=121402 RepID=A0A8T2NUN8_9TELE|nr:hypothetical protein JZ751_012544 [Albula glossodonta]
MELLKNSVAMQEQVLACQGFLVIGYTLEKSSKVHVTRAVLDIFLALARYLSNLQNGLVLLKQLCDHILFNPSIWVHTPAKVQLSLYTYLATEFISTVTIYSAIRRVGTVMQVMHMLKYFYWVTNPQDCSGVQPQGLDGPRPSQKEILSLRAFMLLFIKQLVMKDHGVKEDELQSILNYLLTIHEDDNLMDVLQLLVALMSEHPVSMVPAFDQTNGIRVIYKLLASKNEGVRVQALKVLGYFLKHLQPKRKSEVMMGHSLFPLLSERLILHSHQFSLTTYNVLFEILTEQISTQVVHKQHPDPDSSIKIINPQILKVIAALLKNAPQNPETMEVRRIFLSDMIKMFNNSRENRRSLLQCSVWQDWMLSLCFINPRSSEEQKITEMVYAIFRILLYHAIKYEWGGWRVWVDTLSITHSKVTFEQHKENLVGMLQEYQRGSEGGGAGRIRTVSGSSRGSGPLAQPNGEHAEQEEIAPSTVIELTVEGESERDKATITVSNILEREAEEDEGQEEDQALPGEQAVSETTVPTATADEMQPEQHKSAATEDSAEAGCDSAEVEKEEEEGEQEAGESEHREEEEEEQDSGQSPTAAQSSSGQGKESSSTGQATMFRIPEFQWSHMHQRLLTDLLFSIETDVQMWRSNSTKTVAEFVNSSDNVVFVHNTIHLVSQIHVLEGVEPSQGLAPEASLTFLQRLVSLVDVLIFASSLTFTEVEAEKNMSSGGILRQSLRLVCAMAVRNCLNYQQHSPLRPSAENTRGQKGSIDVGTGGVSPEDSKQAQFLALAVVYFISVLMVSKYRDILEPHNDRRHIQRSLSVRSSGASQSSTGDGIPAGLDNGVTLRRRDSGLGDEQSSIAPSEADSGAGAAVGQDSRSEAPPPQVPPGKNVKDILRSLVSGPAEDIMVDPSLLPPSLRGTLGDTATRNQSPPFHSFDR